MGVVVFRISGWSELIIVMLVFELLGFTLSDHPLGVDLLEV